MMECKNNVLTGSVAKRKWWESVTKVIGGADDQLFNTKTKSQIKGRKVFGISWWRQRETKQEYEWPPRVIVLEITTRKSVTCEKAHIRAASKYWIDSDNGTEAGKEPTVVAVNVQAMW